ncbi:MAG: hypothetical protein GF341_00155, partial [candidate division Zixibacteria bacterium]|nr:hypothetical protein [candidate division Zixibacteria bacterium]
FRDVEIDLAGDVVAVGEHVESANVSDALIVKYMPNGDTAWMRTFSSPGSTVNRAYDIEIGPTNDIWVTGEAEYTTEDCIVLHYSSGGTLLDQYQYDGPAGMIDRGLRLGISIGDAVYVAGRTQNASGDYDIFLLALTSTMSGIDVSSPADNGPGTLRDAIATANSTPGSDTISFSFTGAIALATPLPAVDDADGGLSIDGTTAPGDPANGPLVILDGSALGSGHGIEIASDSNRIEFITIRNFPGDGIHVNSGTNNTFIDNLIYNNGGLGIDLGGDGVTLNDVGDGDSGANDLLNYPDIDSVFLLGPDLFRIAGTAPPNATVELLLADKFVGGDTIADPSGHGEAWERLDSQTATGSGRFDFSSVSVRQWSEVTLTATDGNGNTSEFSTNRLLIPDSLTFTVYSPVELKVINPDSTDSIGPTFNTFGSRASYDDMTDWGLGPDSVPGEPDDQVVVTNIQPGDYTIEVSTKPGEDGNYFMGIRVDGTEESWHGPGVTGSSSPISNPAPPEGDPDVYTFSATPPQRGDLNGDGVLDAVDLNIVINMVFFNEPLPDPPQLLDLNCDGFPDAVDFNYLIEHIFFNGPLPCH